MTSFGTIIAGSLPLADNRSTRVHDEFTANGSTDSDRSIAAENAPDRCSYCGRPFADGEGSLVLMRDGRPVAAYHERCHPHHRRSGCSAC